MFSALNTFHDQQVRASTPLTKPGTKVISISAYDLYMKGNYQNVDRYAEVDMSITGDPQATLPGLIDKALQARFGDQSLRYAYPLESWMVEQSTDPTQGMVTLRSVDGFSVCFSIPRRQQSELGEALVAQPASTVMLRAH